MKRLNFILRVVLIVGFLNFYFPVATVNSIPVGLNGDNGGSLNIEKGNFDPSPKQVTEGKETTLELKRGNFEKDSIPSSLPGSVEPTFNPKLEAMGGGDVPEKIEIETGKEYAYEPTNGPTTYEAPDTNVEFNDNGVHVNEVRVAEPVETEVDFEVTDPGEVSFTIGNNNMEVKVEEGELVQRNINGTKIEKPDEGTEVKMGKEDIEVKKKNTTISFKKEDKNSTITFKDKVKVALPDDSTIKFNQGSVEIKKDKKSKKSIATISKDGTKMIVGNDIVDLGQLKDNTTGLASVGITKSEGGGWNLTVGTTKGSTKFHITESEIDKVNNVEVGLADSGIYGVQNDGVVNIGSFGNDIETKLTFQEGELASVNGTKINLSAKGKITKINDDGKVTMASGEGKVIIGKEGIEKINGYKIEGEGIGKVSIDKEGKVVVEGEKAGELTISPSKGTITRGEKEVSFPEGSEVDTIEVSKEGDITYENANGDKIEPKAQAKAAASSKNNNLPNGFTEEDGKIMKKTEEGDVDTGIEYQEDVDYSWVKEEGILKATITEGKTAKFHITKDGVVDEVNSVKVTSPDDKTPTISVSKKGEATVSLDDEVKAIIGKDGNIIKANGVKTKDFPDGNQIEIDKNGNAIIKDSSGNKLVTVHQKGKKFTIHTSKGDRDHTVKVGGEVKSISYDENKGITIKYDTKKGVKELTITDAGLLKANGREVNIASSRGETIKVDKNGKVTVTSENGKISITITADEELEVDANGRKIVVEKGGVVILGKLDSNDAIKVKGNKISLIFTENGNAWFSTDSESNWVEFKNGLPTETEITFNKDGSFNLAYDKEGQNPVKVKVSADGKATITVNGEKQPLPEGATLTSITINSDGTVQYKYKDKDGNKKTVNVENDGTNDLTQDATQGQQQRGCQAAGQQQQSSSQTGTGNNSVNSAWQKVKQARSQVAAARNEQRQKAIEELTKAIKEWKAAYGSGAEIALDTHLERIYKDKYRQEGKEAANKWLKAWQEATSWTIRFY